MPRYPHAAQAIEAMLFGREGEFGDYIVKSSCAWADGYSVQHGPHGFWALVVIAAGRATKRWEPPQSAIGSLVAWTDYIENSNQHMFGPLMRTLEDLLGEPLPRSADLASGNMTTVLGPLGVAAWRAELLARQPQP